MRLSMKLACTCKLHHTNHLSEGTHSLLFLPDPGDFYSQMHRFPKSNAGFALACLAILCLGIQDSGPPVCNSANSNPESWPYQPHGLASPQAQVAMMATSGACGTRDAVAAYFSGASLGSHWGSSGNKRTRAVTVHAVAVC